MLYFTMPAGIADYELWKSDGTSTGTVLVKRISGWDHFYASQPGIDQLTFLNDTVLFTSDYGLWRSDGTPEGTVAMPASVHGDLTLFRGETYFVRYNRSYQLWKTNGTTAGTVLVKSFYESASIHSPTIELIGASNSLLLLAHDEELGYEAWQSDGTAEGTVLLTDRHWGLQHQSIWHPITVGGKLFYWASDSGGIKYGLWSSDGTVEGTVLIQESDWASYAAIEDIGSISIQTAVGNKLFAHIQIAGVPKLLVSDGTIPGTSVVDLGEAEAADNGSLILGLLVHPAWLTNVNGTLYFSNYSTDHGLELWRSDGTQTGTRRVKNINAGDRSSSPDQFTYLNGALYFTADDSTHGRELWRFELEEQIVPNPILVNSDFDGDGDVDGADFVAWQTNFPKASGATLAQGDADGDGDVDGADFVVWQTNFPTSPSGGAVQASGSASSGGAEAEENSAAGGGDEQLPPSAFLPRSSLGGLSFSPALSREGRGREDLSAELVREGSETASGWHGEAASTSIGSSSDSQSPGSSPQSTGRLRLSVAPVSEITTTKQARISVADNFAAQPKRAALPPTAVDSWFERSSMYRSRSIGWRAVSPIFAEASE
jgi:ELWxxDGT repeat protein